MIFPWVEEEMSAYDERRKDSENGKKATDFALKNFLTLLIEFRTILLQDAALLYMKYPDANIWKYEPFNTPAFVQFSQSSESILTHAAISARHRLETLPETVSISMNGILQTVFIQQSQERNEMAQRFEYIEGLMRGQLISTAKGRKLMAEIGTPSCYVTCVSN
jgi:hypothetical protein